MQLDPVQLLVATFIAGLIVGPAVQLIKIQLQWDGDKALYLALAISIVAGLGAAVMSGVPLPKPEADPLKFVADVGVFCGLVFAFATFIYKKILEKLTGGPLANLPKP